MLGRHSTRVRSSARACRRWAGERPTSRPMSSSCCSVRPSVGSLSSPAAACSSAARASTRSSAGRSIGARSVDRVTAVVLPAGESITAGSCGGGAVSDGSGMGRPKSNGRRPSPLHFPTARRAERPTDFKLRAAGWTLPHGEILAAVGTERHDAIRREKTATIPAPVGRGGWRTRGSVKLSPLDVVELLVGVPVHRPMIGILDVLDEALDDHLVMGSSISKANGVASADADDEEQKIAHGPKGW